MGSPGGRVCESSTWPAQCVLFAERTAQVMDGQSTFVRVVNPSECEVCFWDAQGDVMAARVVRDPAGGVESLPGWCRPQGTRYTCSCMTSRTRCKVRSHQLPRWCASCELPRWCCAFEKKKIENKSKPRFWVNRIPWAGVKDPLSWAQDNHQLGGWVSDS